MTSAIPKLTTVLLAIVALIGCGSTVKQLPSIPGVSATSVVLYLHNDGSGATLDGWVDHGMEKVLIERYVRKTYGVNSVINLISIP